MSTQNVSFQGAVAEDTEYEHPPGYALARELRAALSRRGWSVGEIENWRDSGWEVPCSRDHARLDLVVVGVDRESWYGQISPTDVPGLLGRALGRTPSATETDVFALAADMHEVLAGGGFTHLRWVWDGLPDDGDPGAPPAAPLPRAVQRR